MLNYNEHSIENNVEKGFHQGFVEGKLDLMIELIQDGLVTYEQAIQRAERYGVSIEDLNRELEI